MAKRISHVVLISALFISVYHGTCAQDWDDWATDFTRDLTSNLARMNENINRQVQSVVNGVHQQLQHTLKHSLEPSLKEVAKAVENLPRDAQGRIITSTGNTIIVNGGNGVTKSVISSYTKDGEPYVREVEERNDGSTLYHYETYYKPRTNTSVRTCWKLDHATPGAIPEILKDC